ncbi:hypothetical protein PMI32_04970 [Pseudomonas sp. GM60]|nr:hypothetical protein PMI32_04970 [Pseudomonas sp. GM60]
MTFSHAILGDYLYGTVFGNLCDVDVVVEALGK